MGWGSGSRLMTDVIKKMLEKKIPAESRKAIYEILIPAMQDQDWDTEADCMHSDPVYDAVLIEQNPDWFEEDEDDWDEE